MIKLARDLTYDDLGKQFSVTTTSWLRSPLPVTFDMLTQQLVFDKSLKSEDVNSPAFQPFLYDGAIRNITFKSDGTINVILSTRSGAIKLKPTHEIEVN